MSQGVDGIEPGHPAGRRVTEQNADSCRKKKGDQVDLKIEVEGHMDALRGPCIETEREENTQDQREAGG